MPKKGRYGRTKRCPNCGNKIIFGCFGDDAEYSFKCDFCPEANRCDLRQTLISKIKSDGTNCMWCEQRL